MTKTKKLNSAAIIALKEALSLVYWFKKDLRSFLINTLQDTSILGKINWDDYKRNIANQVVETLARNEGQYQDELLRLFIEVSRIDDFSHLAHLEGGKEKETRANNAVQALKKYTSGFQVLQQETQQREEKRTIYRDELKKKNLFQTQLDELKKQYIQLSVSTNPHKRGYQLEGLLKNLFELFDLDPRASFRIQGEQIDGAFTFENFEYLFEAKWHNEPIQAKDLDVLSAKVQRKLDNTLGLFLSINGFSPESINAHSIGRKLLLLMDGGDIMAVLENRIDFQELLRRKKRHASQTGNILFRYQDMFQ